MYIEEECFSLNKILLVVIGLWPYQQSKFSQIRSISLFSILITGILFQFTTFFTSTCTPDLIIKVLSITLFYMMFVIKYISFGINMEIMKDLLMQLQHTYDKLKDENEYAIVERYSYNAKYYTVILTLIGTLTVCSHIITQNWSSFLDIILPINESRPHNIHFETEYFVNQENYFFLILLHMNAALCVGAMGMLAIGTMLIAYLQHTCGMFRIASYRLERTIKINMLTNNSLMEKNVIYDIICAVDIHRQAMKLSKLLVSRFETMLFCLIAVGVVSLSLNLFRIFHILSSKLYIIDLLIHFEYASIIVIYMFSSNYVGQDVIDHNNHVYTTAYNIDWYLTPLHVWKMILFLLQRKAKSFTLSVGGLFVGSLECFATLVKASVSYFTVISSTR